MDQMVQNGFAHGNTGSHAFSTTNNTDGNNGSNGARIPHFYWCFTYNNYDDDGISNKIGYKIYYWYNNK